jgi:hypothetical protein
VKLRAAADEARRRVRLVREVRARLEEQHVARGILREPGRHRAAARAGADDDDVEVAFHGAILIDGWARGSLSTNVSAAVADRGSAPQASLHLGIRTA